MSSSLCSRAAPSAATAGTTAKPFKLSRSSAPKVRTGCLTCKKRRIKCDETKPACLRCLKVRGHCEGYRSLPNLGPGQIAWDSRELQLRPASRPQCNLSNAQFLDAREQMYFVEFVHLVKQPWVAAACHTDLWEVSLPQVARNDDTLRQAAVGIGALSLWHRHSQQNGLKSALPPSRRDEDGAVHYFNALASYGRALKLHAKTSSLQTTVFLSMLLLMFEVLQGNKKGALNHVNHGLALLLALVTDDDSRALIDDLSPNPRPILGAISDIYNHIGPQARRIVPGRLNTSVPLFNFQRGLRDRQQTMEGFVLSASRLHPQTGILGRIPTEFDTIEEAERFIAAAQQRQHQLGAIVLSRAEESGTLQSSDAQDLNGVFAILSHEMRVTAFCEETKHIAEKLYSALTPLFENILSIGQVDLIKACHLRLQCLELRTFEDPMPYLFLEHARAQTALYRQYVSLAKMTLTAAQTSAGSPAYRFSLQSSLAWRLFLVGFYCRDPLVRREAICLLRDYPGYDGLWNAHALYALAARAGMVEELNAVEGTSEEQWLRLQRREFVFENGGDSVVFRYLRKDEGCGEWELVEESADVPIDPDLTVWNRQALSFDGRLLMGNMLGLTENFAT